MFATIIKIDNARNIMEKTVLIARKFDTDRYVRLYNIIAMNILPNIKSHMFITIVTAFVNENHDLYSIVRFIVRISFSFLLLSVLTYFVVFKK